MDLRFLRLRRWLLKQQPNKTVFNRFMKNQYKANSGFGQFNGGEYEKQKNIQKNHQK